MTAAFPALERLVDPAGGPTGEPVPVSDSFVIGRAPEADLVVPSPLVGRRHCRVELRYGRWWLLELAGSDGVFHNGERVTNAELAHLDTISLPSGHVFRFLAGPEAWLTEPALEAAILAEPDDDTRWAVYADWLAERGAPLGERMSAPRSRDDGRWVGALARAYVSGNLEVEWHRGLPRRVVLRQLARGLASGWQAMTAVLARERSFRFLRAVEIDLESFLAMSPGQDLRGNGRPLAAMLDQLARGALPLLESVRVGPMTAPVESDGAWRSLAALREACPRLTTTEASLFFGMRAPYLEVLASPRGVEVRPPVGHRVVLDARTSNLIGPTPECIVQVDVPHGHPARLVAVRLALVEGRWVLEDLFARSRPFRQPEFALTVNGREIVDALVRPGDVMELASGLLVRFGADRA